MHVDENEKLRAIWEFITMQQATYWYMLPKMHHTKERKKAMKTWKNYFKVGLTSLPQDFPIAHFALMSKLISHLNYFMNVTWNQPYRHMKHQWCFPLQLNINDNTRYEIFGPCETHMMGIVGNECIKSMLYRPGCESWPMLQHNNRGHRGGVHFQHSQILVLLCHSPYHSPSWQNCGTYQTDTSCHQTTVTGAQWHGHYHQKTPQHFVGKTIT